MSEAAAINLKALQHHCSACEFRSLVLPWSTARALQHHCSACEFRSLVLSQSDHENVQGLNNCFQLRRFWLACAAFNIVLLFACLLAV